MIAPAKFTVTETEIEEVDLYVSNRMKNPEALMPCVTVKVVIQLELAWRKRQKIVFTETLIA